MVVSSGLGGAPPMPVEAGMTYCWSQTEERWMAFPAPVAETTQTIEAAPVETSVSVEVTPSGSDTISGA